MSTPNMPNRSNTPALSFMYPSLHKKIVRPFACDNLRRFLQIKHQFLCSVLQWDFSIGDFLREALCASNWNIHFATLNGITIVTKELKLCYLMLTSNYVFRGLEFGPFKNEETVARIPTHSLLQNKRCYIPAQNRHHAKHRRAPKSTALHTTRRCIAITIMCLCSYQRPKPFPKHAF